MKVTFNPNVAAHNPNARPPQAQGTPTTTAPEGSDDGVVISLSPAAKQALKAGAAEYTGNSPAHQARQALAAGEFAFAEGGDGSNTPFGQIVKTFAHAKHTIGSGDTVSEDGGEAAGVTDPADGTDTPPADDGESTVVAGDPDGTVGTDDPPLVVDEPDVTEVLDESAPAEGEVTEPGSGIAGSGDAVASSGDDAPVDEGTPVDSGEPVAVVDTGVVDTGVLDTGDLTDELLDLLNEGSEETV